MDVINRNENGNVWFAAALIAGNCGRMQRTGSGLKMDMSGAAFGNPLAKNWTFVFPATDIDDVEVIGVESRITATRLATLGLAGAGLRKNLTWIRITSGPQEAVFEVRMPQQKTTAWVSQFPWARNRVETAESRTSSKATPKPSVTTELAKLAELYGSGALTDDEFTAAKAVVLSAVSELRADAEDANAEHAVEPDRSVAVEGGAPATERPALFANLILVTPERHRARLAKVISNLSGVSRYEAKRMIAEADAGTPQRVVLRPPLPVARVEAMAAGWMRNTGTKATVEVIEPDAVP